MDRYLSSARGRRGRSNLNTQIRVGLFTVVVIAGILAVFWVLTNIVLQSRGYVIAVHFRNVGGLQEGATVQLAGVNIGIVKSVTLFPDQTVQVVSTIDPQYKIYRQSRFVVATTITGQATLQILPPPPLQLATATPLEPGVLPEEQQPLGYIPPSIADLVQAIEPRIKDLDKTLRIVNRELPMLARRFNSMAGHADQMVVHADSALQQVAGSLSVAAQNVARMSGTLNETAQANRPNIDRMIARLSDAANNLNNSMQHLAEISNDPRFKNALPQTVDNLKDASEKLAKIATDVESITGDPQVQANLRGAIYDLSSAVAKANDILSGFSNARARGPAPPGATPIPGASPAPGASGVPAPNAPTAARPRRVGLGNLLGGGGLVGFKVRETWNERGGGPGSDLGIVLLPRAKTHLTIAGNDLGYNTTYDFMVNRRFSKAVELSGGVYHSNLGLKAFVSPIPPFALDLRVYDPKYPKFDLYGDLKLSGRLDLFYGRKNAFSNFNRLGPSTSTPAFGFELTY